MDAIKAMKNLDPKLIKEAMAVLPVLQLFKTILPKFKAQKVTIEAIDGNETKTKECAAILFDCTPENKRRVTAIEEMFTDILPPFIAMEDFELWNGEQVEHYAAVLFELPEGAK